MDLATLGWDAAFARSSAPYEADGLVPTRVCAEHRGAWRVLAARGELPTSLGGRLRHAGADSRASSPVLPGYLRALASPSGGAFAAPSLTIRAGM